MTAKEMYPNDNRATSACELLALKSKVEHALQGVLLSGPCFATPEEWAVVEGELARCTAQFDRATECLLAMNQANR